MKKFSWVTHPQYDIPLPENHRFTSSKFSDLYKELKTKDFSKNAVILKPKKAIEVSNEEPLKNEIKTFLQCVKKNHKPITDIDEAINVQVVLDMIDKELKKNMDK